MVGGGGREHAIVRALGRSPQAPEILCAPGNPGIERDATLLPIPVTDVPALVAAAREHAVDLVVVGPEAPLVAGLVDALADAAIPAFGPTAAAARVEGSKVHAKELMAAAGVPTGAFAMAATVDDGLAAIGGSYPAVLKYDGLAAGKGVVIAEDEDAARRALEDFLVHRSFGDGQVFVEEHLTGEELSLLALCDGERAIPMAPAQDFKRIGDGDVGPNTGGMGSYSPVPGAGDRARALRHRAPAARRRAAQAGDPVPRRAVRRAHAHAPTARGSSSTTRASATRRRRPSSRACAATCSSSCASRRAPADSRAPRSTSPTTPRSPSSWRAAAIRRRRPAATSSPASTTWRDGVEVTHAGTARRDDGAIVTAGGRVLNVTALGPDIGAARDAAYAAADLITFEGRQLRRDIALRAVGRT